MARLICDACRTSRPEEYASYEAWEDAARSSGWFVGEDLLLCPRCRGGETS